MSMESCPFYCSDSQYKSGQDSFGIQYGVILSRDSGQYPGILVGSGCENATESDPDSEKARFNDSI